MSDNAYIGQTTDVILGQEFLTWLWFTSEARRGAFTTREGEEYFLYVEQRVSVQGGEGENKETATVAGSMSELREARMGLATGKKVNRALVRIERDVDNWLVTLKAEDFSLGSLKTPKVEKADDQMDDEPDAPLLEKMYLIERCLTYLDEAYLAFLKVRLSKEWHDEVRNLNQWLQNAE